MSTTIIPHTHIICPKCKLPAGTVDHLKGSSFKDFDTMWYCEHCGCRYSFTWHADGTVTDVKDTGERMDKTIVLLKHGYIGLVVEGMTHTPGNTNSDGCFYNEHTCPTNYLKHVKAVISFKPDGKGQVDFDPHGIFEYITTLPWSDQADKCNHDEWLETLVPHFIAKPGEETLCE